MARFTPEQAALIAAIQQLINEWAQELDLHNGVNIGKLVTEDCVYGVGDTFRTGRDAIIQNYLDRLERLSKGPEGVPIHRHLISNLRTHFKGDDAASISFNLIYWSTLGMSSGTNHTEPMAYADVDMDVRRDADGEWRIAKFTSSQSFKRAPK